MKYFVYAPFLELSSVVNEVDSLKHCYIGYEFVINYIRKWNLIDKEDKFEKKKTDFMSLKNRYWKNKDIVWRNCKYFNTNLLRTLVDNKLFLGRLFSLFLFVFIASRVLQVFAMRWRSIERKKGKKKVCWHNNTKRKKWKELA